MAKEYQLADGQEDAIVRMYCSGMTSAMIAEELGVRSKNTILKVVRRYGVPVKSKADYCRVEFDCSERRDICFRYMSGETSYDIAREYNVSVPIILRELRRMNIEIDRLGCARRKYFFNQSFFDDIDSPLKAYWLGFIAADGSVSSKRNSLSISLQSRDFKHLLKFRMAINASCPVIQLCGKRRIDVYSNYMVRQLSEYNIVDRKSNVVHMPSGLNAGLEHHYWRGVFDGDGCIHHANNGYWRVTLYGSEPMMNDFKSWVSTICDTSASVHKTKTCYLFGVGGNRMPMAVAAAMYADATYDSVLDRKYELYQDMLGSLAYN